VPVQNCLVGQLLAYAAAPAEHRDARAHWQLADVDEREFEWVLRGGLGALLHYATREQSGVVPVSWRERLLSEALTARVRHAERIDAACEVIELCRREGVPVTLLKGISTSEQFYPAGYLRPMADVDVLVPANECRRVEAMLRDAGYRGAGNYQEESGQNHGAPLCHPTFGIWIEIHRSLFHRPNELSTPAMSDTANIIGNSQPITFHGVAARRFASELQLIYIASSWMQDLMRFSIQPSFLSSIFDAIFLMEREHAMFNWSKLLALTGNDVPTAALHVLASYLDCRSFIQLPSTVHAALAVRQKLVGAGQLRVIHAVLDRHLIGGRPWRYPIPLPVAGRYSVQRQWNKRVLRRP
jgi:hypothetical protein